MKSSLEQAAAQLTNHERRLRSRRMRLRPRGLPKFGRAELDCFVASLLAMTTLTGVIASEAKQSREKRGNYDPAGKTRAMWNAFAVTRHVPSMRWNSK